MPNYRRIWQPGGTYFFTVALLQRRNNDLLVRHVEDMRRAVAYVRRRHPFKIHGWVVLPDHLHCVIELPNGDVDYSTRWSLIKQYFSKSIPAGEYRNEARQRREERGIWQRRYWEHLIRDEDDFNAHMDYVHYNPIKHGLVSRIRDWPYSTFHKLVERGRYSAQWGEGAVDSMLLYDD